MELGIELNPEVAQKAKELKRLGDNMPTKLKQILIEGEKFYSTLSFDIGENDRGLWWLQIYDNDHNLIYDKPFTSSRGILDKKKIRKIIKDEFLTLKGELV